MSTRLEMLVEASKAREITLPEMAPLTLTKNFGWVFLFCLAVLVTAPLVIAWSASLLLSG